MQETLNFDGTLLRCHARWRATPRFFPLCCETKKANFLQRIRRTHFIFGKKFSILQNSVWTGYCKLCKRILPPSSHYNIHTHLSSREWILKTVLRGLQGGQGGRQGQGQWPTLGCRAGQWWSWDAVQLDRGGDGQGSRGRLSVTRYALPILSCNSKCLSY